MSKAVKSAFLIFVSVFISSSLFAMPQAENKDDKNPVSVISSSRWESGDAVLGELSVAGGKLAFVVETGGCTDKDSFRVRIKKEKGIAPGSSHYVLTVERIKIDDCKAFFPDGVGIEIDLEKDLGLTGDFTVTVTNPIRKSSL